MCLARAVDNQFSLENYVVKGGSLDSGGRFVVNTFRTNGDGKLYFALEVTFSEFKGARIAAVMPFNLQRVGQHVVLTSEDRYKAEKIQAPAVVSVANWEPALYIVNDALRAKANELLELPRLPDIA